MKTKMLSLLILLSLVSFLSGCNQSREHQLINNKPSIVVDTTDGEVTFSNIKPILENRCVRCHNSGANDWRIESNIQRVAKSGAINQRLTTSGALAMPATGSPEATSFSQSERNLILAYVVSLTSSTTTQKDGTQPTQNVLNPYLVSDMTLAMVSRCTACHGVSGRSIAPNIPNLAGHHPKFIQQEHERILTDSRKDSSMNGIVKKLAEDFQLAYKQIDETTIEPSAEMQTSFALVAEFFSNQNVTPNPDEYLSSQQNLNTDTKALFDKGQGIVKSKFCTSCHLSAPNMKPLSNMPMIFGQKQSYLETRLKLFKEGKAGLTMPALMMGFQLTDEDITAVSTYLSLEHPHLFKN